MVGRRGSLRPVDGRTDVPLVVLVSCDEVTSEWLRSSASQLGELISVSRPEELSALRTERSVDVVIVGSHSRDPSAFDSLFRTVGSTVPVLVAVPNGAPEPPPDPRVFYVVRPSLSHDDVLALLRGALHRAAPATAIPSPAHAERLQRILSASARFVSARDLAEAAKVAELSVRGFVTADRVHCLFHDAESGALWSETDEGREGQATAGLAGFVARTGQAVAVERAEADPRFDRALDDPQAEGRTCMMVVPVGDRDGVHAVFIAARSDAPPFTALERELMETFADRAGPLMHHLALLVEAEAIVRAQRERLFRAESLRAHADQGHRGDVVRVSPAWIRWAYWVLVGLAIASVVYVFVGEVDQYSTGPAIVRVHERTELVARSSGPLLAVHVAPGQRVEAGAALASLDDTALRAELHRVRRELDAQLRKRMLDPSDPVATQALYSLRGQLRGVTDRLESRMIRAPHAGTVSDMRIRAGQHIEVGDVVMSLVHEDERRRVVALLPGSDRPQLHPGMSLRLELSGYRYAYQSLVIEEVSSEVIGPAEARRFLGPQIGDSVTIPGPVVVVHAALAEASFEADGSTYDYHDGMLALAEVRVRTESILELFFPAIKRLDADA